MRRHRASLRLAAALLASILLLPSGVALLCGSTRAKMDEMPGMQHATHQDATQSESGISTSGAGLGCLSLVTCASQQPTAFAPPTRFEPGMGVHARRLARHEAHLLDFTPVPATPPPRA